MSIEIVRTKKIDLAARITGNGPRFILILEPESQRPLELAITGKAAAALREWVTDPDRVLQAV